MENNTKENEDVLIIGNDCKNYLASNRQTNNKFFYQMPPLNNSDGLYAEFLSESQDNPSDVIIVPKSLIYSEDKKMNMLKYIEMLASQDDLYTSEEMDDFFVYRKIGDKNG